MIDRQRPSRLASLRAKAYFLGDVSISRQLEKEERDLRKALKISRMEAQRAKKNENEIKSVRSSSPTPSSPSSSSSSSLSKSSSSLSFLPPVTKITKTATISQKRKVKMGKPKAMEISKIAKDMKGCCKNINQVKPATGQKLKSKWIIKTRSQNNVNNSNHVNCPDSTSGDKELYRCEMQSNSIIHDGKIVDNLQSKNQPSNIISSSVVTCALQLDKGNNTNDLLSINGTNCDKPRPKIMAQRKFASITYTGNTYLKPRDKELSPTKELFTKHKPSAEDFLTFLCFRTTDLLPPHLDFYALNNITSKDGTNMLPNGVTTDKTASEDSDSLKKSHDSQSNQSNSSTSNSIKTNKGPNNGKVQNVRKRASISVNSNRKTAENRKKNFSERVKAKVNLDNNSFTVDRKNSVNLSKNVIDLRKSNISEKTIKTAGITTRGCTSSTKSNTDENRPKKSSDVSDTPINRSPQSSCPPMSQTKVSKPRKKATNDSQADQVSIHLISNGKISKRSLSQPEDLCSEYAEIYRKAKAKDNCDRILRSTRKSSSTPKKAAGFVEEALQLNGGQELIKIENPVENANIITSIEKSAINESSVNSPKRKRAGINCNSSKKWCSSIPDETIVMPSAISAKSCQSKKNGAIKTASSEVTTPLSNHCKDTTKFAPHRIETRSCTKR